MNKCKEEYECLVDIVNANLLNSNKKTIVFEVFENISDDIFNFPVNKLLNIHDNRVFIYEAYYKILDRTVDTPSYERFFGLLNNKQITKDQIISTLNNSQEKLLKKTKLIF